MVLAIGRGLPSRWVSWSREEGSFQPLGGAPGSSQLAHCLTRAPQSQCITVMNLFAMFGSLHMVIRALYIVYHRHIVPTVATQAGCQGGERSLPQTNELFMNISWDFSFLLEGVIDIGENVFLILYMN